MQKEAETLEAEELQTCKDSSEKKSEVCGIVSYFKRL